MRHLVTVLSNFTGRGFLMKDELYYYSSSSSSSSSSNSSSRVATTMAVENFSITKLLKVDPCLFLSRNKKL